MLVGGSSTGKTRALWEAIQPLEGWRVWRPADHRTLLDDLAESSSLAHTVLWLNEAQRYLLTPQPGEGEQAAAALTELLVTPERGPVLVVGTLWREHHHLLTRPPAVHSAGGDQHQCGRALIGSGTTIPVPEEFSDEDLEVLLDSAIHDPRLAEALEHAGRRVAQYLAGARELMHLYRLAPPEARALLDAAADARRLGHAEVLPESFLRAAAGAYLDPEHWRAQTDEWRATWFDRATAYTSQPSRGIPGPLTRDSPLPGLGPDTDEPAYLLADYLLQHLSESRRLQMPPEGFWAAAASLITNPDDLKTLGEAAEKRWRLRTAASLFQRAADAGDTNALLTLARYRLKAKDPSGAERIYQQAADAGETDAMAPLAMLREKAGDTAGADNLAQEAAKNSNTRPSGSIGTETSGSRAILIPVR